MTFPSCKLIGPLKKFHVVDISPYSNRLQFKVSPTSSESTVQELINDVDLEDEPIDEPAQQLLSSLVSQMLTASGNLSLPPGFESFVLTCPPPVFWQLCVKLWMLCWNVPKWCLPIDSPSQKWTRKGILGGFIKSMTFRGLTLEKTW